VGETDVGRGILDGGLGVPTGSPWSVEGGLRAGVAVDGWAGFAGVAGKVPPGAAVEGEPAARPPYLEERPRAARVAMRMMAIHRAMI